MINKTYKTGAFVDKEDPRDYRIAKYIVKMDLPKKYDLTHLMGPVRNQGQEGTCVAFASAAIKESEEIGEGMMSPRFLYNIIGLPGGGAYPRDAMKALTDFGICPEIYNPYQINKAIPNNEPMFDKAKPNKIKGYARLTTLGEMKQTLFQNGAFLLTVGVTNNWFNVGLDGILADGGDIIGYHALAFVGYDDEFQRVKIKNSWGPNWGAGGYGYIGYDMLMRILSDAWSSIDIPEAEEEKPKLIPVKQKKPWVRVWDFINIFKIRV